jgi:hypothetical protein
MFITQLPRLNARWRDPYCEGIVCLHLPDTAWLRENNYCNPLLWSALPALAAKLLQSGAPSTIVAPLLAQQAVVPSPSPFRSRNAKLPSSCDLLFFGMLGTHAGVGTRGWSIVVFRQPRRLGSTPAVEP